MNVSIKTGLAILMIGVALSSADSTDLLIEHLTDGGGNCNRPSKKGDVIKIHFTGTLASTGKQFDSSIGRGPFEFELGAGRVIKGLDQGLLGMCPQDKRKLTIPPELGYGSRMTGDIPADATLVFEAQLLEIDHGEQIGDVQPKEMPEMKAGDTSSNGPNKDECNMDSLLSSILPPILQAAGYSPSCMKEAIQNADKDGSIINQTLEALDDIKAAIQDLKPLFQQSSNQLRPRNCADLYDQGHNSTATGNIFPYSCCPDINVSVICDQDSDGGKWTIIQRRQDIEPREDFSRSWFEYVLGFGKLETEFWMGLKLIHELTSQNLQELHIDLEDIDGNKRHAKYGYFHVDGPQTNYKLSIGRYSGDAGDAFSTSHNGYDFSTYDQDNDVHDTSCAERFKGGWWYDKCHMANLNGLPHLGPHDSYADGINWQPWLGYHNSLSAVTMKIRPAY